MRETLLLTLLFSMTAAACGAGDGVDGDGTSADEIRPATVFVRSDQVHYGRAPANTVDLSAMVDPDRPLASAEDVIAYVRDHDADARPVYLGCVHAWLFNDDASYRTNWQTLASHVRTATGHHFLVYFEEQNATHSPDPVQIVHAPALRALAANASLLLATYATGRMSHVDVVDKIHGFRFWYNETLHVPMADLMIDIDTSQTTSAFYYGTRGDLAQFNLVIGWALTCAYNQGFAGFHTMGNSRLANGSNGTWWAADSTYVALDHAWAALEEAHPHQQFEGTR
jgi:hypothetical protein